MRAAYGASASQSPAALKPVLTRAPPPAARTSSAQAQASSLVCSPEATTAIDSGPLRLAWWRRRRAMVSASCSGVAGSSPRGPRTSPCR